MKHLTLQMSLALAFGLCTLGAQAAMLNNGDHLTINPGIYTTDTNGNITNVTVSWFAMDSDGNSKIAGSEKSVLMQGSKGIVIGVTQPPGEIDGGAYFGYPLGHVTTSPITGGTTSGLDFSGWAVNWSGLLINMGSGAWGAGFSNGVANFAWSGVYDSAYSLDYAATVPLGDPSGFGGVKYKLHLEGTVQAVPVPAAVWLLGSGLIALAGAARRRKG